MEGKAKQNKDFWKIMNQLTRREKGSKGIGPVRNDTDLSAYDDHGKSVTMNSFFATVGQKLASKFPPSAKDADSLLFTSRVTPIF